MVDKPAGLTSHDVVARGRRLAGTRKVGHAGTLDPMATGVLVLGVERATKLLGHLALTTKEYAATIRLGQSTITDDAEGEVTGGAPADAVTEEAVRAGIAPLTGEILQVPSSVSAIKVDGQRSYARVRAGEEVELAARPVTVSRFELLAVRRADGVLDLDVLVECSSGTYIRALARDLGAALGVGGHLTALRRTRVGPFGLAEAHTLPELEELVGAGRAAGDPAVGGRGEFVPAPGRRGRAGPDPRPRWPARRGRDRRHLRRVRPGRRGDRAGRGAGRCRTARGGAQPDPVTPAGPVPNSAPGRRQVQCSTRRGSGPIG